MIIKKPLWTMLCCCLSLSAAANEVTKVRAPSTIIAKANEQSWRKLDLENTLLVELNTGTAVIEMNPTLAPNHVDNTKKLIRSGFYEGLNFYRFVEGFVAQGGDMSGDKKVVSGSRSIPSERYKQTQKPIDIVTVSDNDGYAKRTGFLNGFAVAQNEQGTQTWQTHCPGALGMARETALDSGGTEFYVVLGHAPRYLDRNITVYGRVISGLEHFLQLSREPKKEGTPFNPIKSIQVASDVKTSKAHHLRVLKTNTAEFKELIAARKNRPEDWFVETPNFVDVCNVAIPTKQITQNL